MVIILSANSALYSRPGLNHKTFCESYQTEVNSSLKNVGFEKFWPDLEISDAFVIGAKVSFSGDLVSRSLIFF